MNKFVHLRHLIFHVQTNIIMEGHFNGTTNTGGFYAEVVSADCHARQNRETMRSVEEPTFTVITPGGYTHKRLSQEEADRLCNSEPGSRCFRDN